MTILKKTFFFIFIFFILSFIFLLIIADIFNIKKTTKNIENDHDIIINLTTEPDWKFFPEIKLNFSGKIKNSTNQFYAENTNFSFAQSYHFVRRFAFRCHSKKKYSGIQFFD